MVREVTRIKLKPQPQPGTQQQQSVPQQAKPSQSSDLWAALDRDMSKLFGQ